MNTSDTKENLWIRRYAPAADAPSRLVCFPHAGGSASYFHPAARRLADRVDVVALQYPARQDRRREPAITTIARYADEITDVLLSLPDRPTVFFGHSMGAVLAFEVAVRLERLAGPAPGALIASGRQAPSVSRNESVHLRDDDGILAELNLLNGTESALLADDEILRMTLPAIRADYTAIETYRCPAGRVVHCPITVLVGDDDPRTTIADAESWRAHTTGGFRMRVFPGGHFFLNRCQSEVLREMTTELDKLVFAQPMR